MVTILHMLGCETQIRASLAEEKLPFPDNSFHTLRISTSKELFFFESSEVS